MKTHNPALNPDALHAASRHSVRRLAPRLAVIKTIHHDQPF